MDSHNGTKSCSGAVKCGSGTAIIGVTGPHKSIQQLVLWTAIEDLGGIQGGAKNVGNSGGFMGMARGGHPTKWAKCTTVQGNPWNHIRGNDISDTL